MSGPFFRDEVRLTQILQNAEKEDSEVVKPLFELALSEENQPRIFAKNVRRNGNFGKDSLDVLKTKDAGVAELADARDLKSEQDD